MSTNGPYPGEDDPNSADDTANSWYAALPWDPKTITRSKYYLHWRCTAGEGVGPKEISPKKAEEWMREFECSVIS